MFNMFVVALVLLSRTAILKEFTYHVKNIGQVSPSAGKWTYLTYFSKP